MSFIPKVTIARIASWKIGPFLLVHLHLIISGCLSWREVLHPQPCTILPSGCLGGDALICALHLLDFRESAKLAYKGELETCMFGGEGERWLMQSQAEAWSFLAEVTNLHTSVCTQKHKIKSGRMRFCSVCSKSVGKLLGHHYSCEGKNWSLKRAYLFLWKYGVLDLLSPVDRTWKHNLKPVWGWWPYTRDWREPDRLSSGEPKGDCSDSGLTLQELFLLKYLVSKLFWWHTDTFPSVISTSV